MSQKRDVSIERFECRCMLAADLVGAFAASACKVIELELPSDAPRSSVEMSTARDGSIFYQTRVEGASQVWIADADETDQLFSSEERLELEHVYEAIGGQILIYTRRSVSTNDPDSGYQDGTSSLVAYDVVSASHETLLELGIWTSDGMFDTDVHFYESDDGLVIQRDAFESSMTRTDFWLSDGTLADTHAIGETTFKGLWQNAVERVVELNGSYLFDGEWDNQRQGIWSLDTKTKSVELVKEFSTAPEGFNLTTRGPYGLTRVGNEVFFAADDDVTDFELWSTDGTTEGTELVADINPIPYGPNENGFWAPMGGSTPFELTELNDQLYFFADDSEHGDELWASDGSPAGTQLVKDFVAGSESKEIIGLANVDGALVVLAEVEHESIEIWRSDGNQSGTELVAELAGDVSSFDESVVAHGQLFFLFDDGVHGQELWATNGTADGTQLAADTLPGNESSRPHQLVVSNDQLLYFADDGSGFDLWSVSLGPGTVGSESVDGDTNADGLVDFLDFLALSRHFGMPAVEGGVAAGDFNFDRVVDFLDFLVLSENFG